MPRTIYLAVLSNGARPAHFSVFVPTGDKGETGKVIHVTGNPATGFFLQFKRNYDLATSEYSLYNLIPSSRVDDRYIKDTVGNGQPAEDTIARDRLESVATTVPPPGRSANSFDPSDWLRDYVQRLIDEELVERNAGVVVENVPKVLG
ncbi:predicted protein [Aspergillus terreus NIH2624]|uniref:Uncharacterized protein n=1 Tax=Aspergillus terreus (strain NIH 2624 / FGSC A1156) TaxID=341663 RepID=Q0CP82_ASPTN|nr:uncharacterized protein ATEG_04502 [Aspergillus terreus NIH2624]EAU34949.1 predicted protein [Aspergillus terreus NIH2624]